MQYRDEQWQESKHLELWTDSYLNKNSVVFRLQRSLGILLSFPLEKSLLKLLNFKENLAMPTFDLSHSGLKLLYKQIHLHPY